MKNRKFNTKEAAEKHLKFRQEAARRRAFKYNDFILRDNSYVALDWDGRGRKWIAYLLITTKDTLNNRKKVQEIMNVKSISELIEHYSQHNIYIEILCHAYKLNINVSYRGSVTWKENDKWLNDDVGCYNDWQTAFNKSIDFADELLNKRNI